MPGFMNQNVNWSLEDEDDRWWAEAEATYTRAELARSRQDGLVLLTGLMDLEPRIYAEHDEESAKF